MAADMQRAARHRHKLHTSAEGLQQDEDVCVCVYVTNQSYEESLSFQATFLQTP